MRPQLRKIVFVISYLPAYELLGRTLMGLWLSGYEAERIPADAAALTAPQEGAASETADGAEGELQDGMCAKEGTAAEAADGAEGELQDGVCAQEGILVVTDLPEVAARCVQNGCAVLGYLHEKNRDASFQGVRYLTEDISGVDPDFCETVYRRAHGIPRIILETKRCVVREIRSEDVDRLYEIYADPAVKQYIEPLFADRQEEITYTKNYIANVYGFYGYGMWIVEDRADGAVIGRAGIEPKEDGAELGYVIAREYRNRGYATEVCRAVLAYAWAKLQLGEVCARVKKENAASVRVCEKLGMERVPCEKINVDTGKSGCYITYKAKALKEFL